MILKWLSPIGNTFLISIPLDFSYTFCLEKQIKEVALSHNVEDEDRGSAKYIL